MDFSELLGLAQENQGLSKVKPVRSFSTKVSNSFQITCISGDLGGSGRRLKQKESSRFEAKFAYVAP